jgi:hypothetical protein
MGEPYNLTGGGASQLIRAIIWQLFGDIHESKHHKLLK